MSDTPTLIPFYAQNVRAISGGWSGDYIVDEIELGIRVMLEDTLDRAYELIERRKLEVTDE